MLLTYEELYAIAYEYVKMFGDNFNIYNGPEYYKYLISEKLKREVEYRYCKFNDYYFYEDITECDTYDEVIELIDYYLDNLQNMANLLANLPDNHYAFGEQQMSKYLIEYAQILAKRREGIIGFMKNFNNNIKRNTKSRNRA